MRCVLSHLPVSLDYLILFCLSSCCVFCSICPCLQIVSFSFVCLRAVSFVPFARVSRLSHSLLFVFVLCLLSHLPVSLDCLILFCLSSCFAFCPICPCLQIVSFSVVCLRAVSFVPFVRVSRLSHSLLFVFVLCLLSHLPVSLDCLILFSLSSCCVFCPTCLCLQIVSFSVVCLRAVSFVPFARVSRLSHSLLFVFVLCLLSHLPVSLDCLILFSLSSCCVFCPICPCLQIVSFSFVCFRAVSFVPFACVSRLSHSLLFVFVLYLLSHLPMFLDYLILFCLSSCCVVCPICPCLQIVSFSFVFFRAVSFVPFATVSRLSHSLLFVFVLCLLSHLPVSLDCLILCCLSSGCVFYPICPCLQIISFSLFVFVLCLLSHLPVTLYYLILFCLSSCCVFCPICPCLQIVSFSFVCLRAVSFVPFVRVSRLSHSLLLVFVLCLLSHLPVSLDCLILFCLSSCCVFCPIYPCLQIVSFSFVCLRAVPFVPFARVSRLSHSLLFVFVLCLLFHLPVSLDCLILFCLFSCCVFCPICPCLQIVSFSFALFSCCVFCPMCPCLQIVSFSFVCFRGVSFVPFARVSRLSHSLFFVFVLCLLSHLPVSLDCLILCCLSSCCVFCPICPCLQIVSFSFVCLRAVSFVPFTRVSRLSHSLLFVFVLCLLYHFSVSLDCLILFCLSSCCVVCPICPCLQIVSFSFVFLRAVSFVPFATVSRLSHSLLFVFVLCLLSHLPVSLDCLILCCLSSWCVFYPICPCLQIISFSLFVFVLCLLSHLPVTLYYLIPFCLSSCCVFCPICPCLQIVSFSFVCLRAVSFVPFVRVSRLSHSLLFVFVLCRFSNLSVSLDCLILFCFSSCCVFCSICHCLQIVSFSFVCLRGVSFFPFARVSRLSHSLLFCLRAVSFVPFARVSRLSHSLLFVFVLCLLSHFSVSLDYLILFCLSSCCVFCPICPCLQIVSFSFVCLRAVSFVPFVRVSRLSHSLLLVFVLCLLSHLPVSLDCLILFCLSSCCVFCPIYPCLQIVSFSFVCLRAVPFVPFARVSRLSHSLLFVFVLCLLFHLPVSLDCLILFCLFSCCVFCPICPCLQIVSFSFVLFSCCVFCPICPCLQIVSFSFVCFRAVSFVPFARVSRLSHSLLFVFVLCLLFHLPMSLDCLILFCLSSCCVFCSICPCLQIVSFSFVCLRAVSFVPFVRVSRLSHSLLCLSSCCVFCSICPCLQIVSFSFVCLRPVSFVPFARVSRLSHSLLFVFVLCLLSHLPVSLDHLILFFLSSCCVVCPVCPCLQIVSFSFVCFRAVSFVPFARVSRLSHSLLFVFVLCLLSHLPVSLDYLILFCLYSCCVFCPICPCLQIISFSFVCLRAVSFVPFVRVSRFSHSLLFVFVLFLLSHLSVSLDCLILFCLSSCCVFQPICPCLQIISFSFACLRAVSFVPFARLSRLSHSLLFVFVLCLFSHFPVSLDCLILFCLSLCCAFCPICPCLQIVSFSFVCFRAVSFVPFARASRLSHSLLFVFVLCLLSHLSVSLDCLISFICFRAVSFVPFARVSRLSHSLCLFSCCVFCSICPCLQIVSFSVVCLRAVSFVPFFRVSRLSHSLLLVFVLCLLSHLPVSLDCLILFCLSSCCVFCPICPCLQIVSFSFVCLCAVPFVPFARVSRLSHSLLLVFVLCLLSHLPVSLDCLILFCLSSCCVFCPICPCLQIVSFSFVCLRAVPFVPFSRVSRLSHSLLFVFVLCLLSHLPVSLDYLILFCLSSCCVFCSICPFLQIVSFSFVCLRAVSFVPFARVSRLSHSLLFVFVLSFVPFARFSRLSHSLLFVFVLCLLFHLPVFPDCLIHFCLSSCCVFCRFVRVSRLSHSILFVFVLYRLSHLSVSLDCLILFCLSPCCIVCPICPCLQIVSFYFVCLRAVSFVPFVRVSKLSHSLLFVFVLCLLFHLPVSLDCLILFCLSSCGVFCPICPCLQIISFSFVCLRAVSFVPFARVSRLSHSLLFVFVLCILFHLPVSLDCLILFCLSSCCVFCPICPCLQIVSFSFVCLRAVSFVPFSRVTRLSHSQLFVFVLCLLSHLPVSLDYLILFCLFSCCVFCSICPCLQIVSFSFVCLRAVSFVPFDRVSRLSHSLLFVFVLCLVPFAPVSRLSHSLLFVFVLYRFSHLSVSLDCLILFCLSSCSIVCPICPCLQIVSFSFVCLHAVSFVPFARVSRLSHSLLFVFVLCLLFHLPVSLDCLILFCLSSCCVFCPICPCLQIISFSFVCLRAVSFVPFARVSRLSHSLLFVFVLCLLSHLPVSLACLILCCLSSCCVFCPICPCLQIVSFSVVCLRAVSFVPFARVSRLSHSLLFVFLLCLFSHLPMSLDCFILFSLSSCCVFCPICPCPQIVSFSFVCLRAVSFVPFARVSRLSHSLLFVFVLCRLSHLSVSLDCLILFCFSSCCVFCSICHCLQIVSFSFVCFRAVSFVPFARVSRLSHSLLFVFVVCLLSHLPASLDYLILFCLSSCCVFCSICPCLQIVLFSFVCLRAVSFVPFARVSRLSHSLLFVFVLCLLFHLPVSLDCLILFCLSSCCVFCPICPCLQLVSFSVVCLRAVSFVPFARVSRLSHSLLFVFVLCLLSHLPVSLDCLILFCLSSCCVFSPIYPCLQIVSFSLVCLRAVSFVPFVRVPRLSHSLLFVFVLYLLSHLPVSLDYLILFCLSSCCVVCPICPCLQIVSFSFVFLRAVSFVPFATVSRLSHSLLFVFVLCLLSHLPVSLDCLILFCLSSWCVFYPICPRLQIISFSFVCLRAVSFVPFARVSRLSHSLLFVFVLCLLSHLSVSLDCLIHFCLSSCCVFCPICPCLQIISFSFVCLRAMSFVPFTRVSRLSHSLWFVFVLCLLSHLPVSLDYIILFCLSSCCVFCSICPCLQIVSFSFVCFRAVSFVPFARVSRLSHSLLFVLVLCLLSHLSVSLDCLILFCLFSCCVFCSIYPCLQIVSFSFVCFRAVSFVPFAHVSRLSHSLLFVFVLCLLSHLTVSLDCLILFCLSSCCVFCSICPCLQIVSFSFVCLRAVSFVPFARVSRLSHSHLFVFVLCLLFHLPVSLDYLNLFCLSSCCIFYHICPCLQIISFSFVCFRAVSFVPFARVSRLSHSLLFVFVLCLLSHLPVSLDYLILFCLSSCCVFCPICPSLQIVSFSFVCLRAVSFVPFARVSRLSHSLLFVFVRCLLFHLPLSLDYIILFCLSSSCIFCHICPCLQIISFSFVCFRAVSFVPFTRVSRLSHSLLFVFVLCLLSHLPASLDYLILFCLSSCCVFCPICPCLQIISFSFVCLRAVSFVPFVRVSRLSHSLLFVFVLCLLSHLSVSLDYLILFCLSSCYVFCPIYPCLQIVSFSLVCLRAVPFVPFARVSRLYHSLLFVFVLCLLFHLPLSLDCLILFCLFSCCVFCPICPCLQIVSFSFVCFSSVSFVPFVRVSRLSHSLLFVFVLCLLFHLPVSLDCLILFCLFSCCVFCSICPCLQIVSFSFVCLRAVSFVPFDRVSRLSHSLLFVFVLCLLFHLPLSLDCLILFCLSSCCIFCPICPCLQIVSFSFVCFRAVSFVPFARVSRLSHSLLFVFVLYLLSHLPVSLDYLILFCLFSCCVICPICPCLQIVSFSVVCLLAVSFVPFARVSRLSHSLLFVFVLCLLFHLSVSLDYLILFCLSSCCVFLYNEHTLLLESYVRQGSENQLCTRM